MVTKHALLVTKLENNSIGTLLTATAVPIEVDESSVLDGCWLNGRNETIRLNEIQPDAEFGSIDRVVEEATNQCKFVILDGDCLFESDQPSWLFPVAGIHTSTHNVTARLDDISLFKSGYFQMACWSRLVWGTVFFENSATPIEHLKLAASVKLKVGNSLPVTGDGGICGVLKLERELSDREFEASVFLLGDKNLTVQDELYLGAEMSCEGIFATFKFKVATLTRVLSTA